MGPPWRIIAEMTHLTGLGDSGLGAHLPASVFAILCAFGPSAVSFTALVVRVPVPPDGGPWAPASWRNQYCNVRIGCYSLELEVVTGEVAIRRNMDPWWWVPIGLAVWFVVGLAIALLIGPVLRRSSQARESPAQQSKEIPDGHGPPRDERQAS
jgi:hypothetical protein